jgi:hypothetical protein
LLLAALAQRSRRRGDDEQARCREDRITRAACCVVLCRCEALVAGCVPGVETEANGDNSELGQSIRRSKRQNDANEAQQRDDKDATATDDAVDVGG